MASPHGDMGHCSRKRNDTRQWQEQHLSWGKPLQSDGKERRVSGEMIA